ncbi:MAG TPA: tyrosine-type recombinase/integrase [Candidatus Paceibacterota bacterium]|jgi:site-specific recombinase XerD
MTSLKSFAEWAGWGKILKDYKAPVDAPTVAHPIPEGVEGVRRMILAAKDEKHQALVALCGLMGLRIREALTVRAKDFNLQDMILTVRGKGDKVRHIPISPEAWAIIQMPVVRAFCESNERPVIALNERYARLVVKKLGKTAGLRRPISSHELRATFATAVYDTTLDIRLVQELLGHASVETAQIYTKVNDNKKREAVQL